MKKYKFYLITIFLTLFVGLILYFVFDYSSRVKLLFNLVGQKDREKIITAIVDKVDSEIMKQKMQKTLITFANKIDGNLYSDDYLKELLKDFEIISNQKNIDSLTVEEFSNKVNREF